MIILSVFAPIITPFNPYEMSLPDRYQTPSTAHLFGTDQNGSDMFSRTLYGARISLFVAISVVTISLLIGLIIGSLAGFWGGWIDLFLMRVVDMIYAFPGFLLALALVAVMGPSLRNLILAMCLTGWAGYARLVRGEILHLKTREHVEAAKALGANKIRLLILHIWPNLVAPLSVQATFGLAGTIITESGLSFLGLGAPPTEPTWGALLNAGRKALIEAPHMSIFPGIAIILLVVGFNLIGEGLRVHLDPRKSKH